MAKPDKAAKRARKALRTFTKNTAVRLDDVLKNPSGMTPTKVAKYLAEQFFDGVDGWLGLMQSFAGEPPTVVLDVDMTGGGAKNGHTDVDLDEPVNNVSHLGSTPLTAPGVATSLTMTLERIPPPPAPSPPEVERITIDVPVPAGQAHGLYSGFVMMGQAIQLHVHVWVHT